MLGWDGAMRTRFALFAVGAWLPSCAAVSGTVAAREAKTALQRSSLDAVLACPHRCGKIRPQFEVYRGCGKYAVLRCTYTTEKSACITVEAIDAKTAEAAAPMSFVVTDVVAPAACLPDSTVAFATASAHRARGAR